MFEISSLFATVSQPQRFEYNQETKTHRFDKSESLYFVVEQTS